jgi:hypothetical protein
LRSFRIIARIRIKALIKDYMWAFT